MAYIRGSNTAIKEKKLVRELNVTTNSTLSVAGVSPTKLVNSAKAVQNGNQDDLSPTTRVEVPSQLSRNTGQSQSESVNNRLKSIYHCPIKVVDMKKLLEKPEYANSRYPEKTHFKTSTLKHTLKQRLGQLLEKSEGTLENHLKKPPREQRFTDKRNSPLDTSQITVFHILECLRVILPNEFNLALLVPNEKVASLIIKYYKLNDDKVGRNSVVAALKLVINSTRLKEKVFEDNLSSHPYMMISDEAIKAVLSRTLPATFSLANVSKEVLKCICKLLKQEVFSDGYQILLHRIKKYSTEAKDVPKEKVDNQTLLNKRKKIVYRGSKKSISSDKVHNSRRESSFTSVPTIQYPFVKTESEQVSNTDNSCSVIDDEMEDPLLEDETDVNDDQHDMDWTPETEATDSDDKEFDDQRNVKDNEWTPAIKNKQTSKCKSLPSKTINMKNVLKYLEIKKCKAKDVLGDFRLMFYLCRHLKTRTRRANLRQIENLLKIIMKRKVQTSSELEDDAKLKLKPIVIMNNLADYSKEKMLFLRSEENYHNSNNYCDNHQGYLGPVKSEKYRDDQVMKLTEGCYKLFRKIIMKRNNAAVVFRLKYARLTQGSVVFVKDFWGSSRAWFRGTVNKQLGPLKYSVTLDSGEIRHYVPEQLRPIIPKRDNKLATIIGTNLISRRNRPIKLKQLLDL